MIKPRGIIIITAALAIAFLTANIASRYLKQSGPGGVTVVAAVTDILNGEQLTPENLKTVGWPGSDIPRGMFHSTREAVGRVAADTIYQGESITEMRLQPKQRRSQPKHFGKIASGMRAVSVEVDRAANPFGILAAGDLVDVIAVSALDKKKKEKISRVILSRVEILTVSNKNKPPGERKTSAKKRITLLLSPKDASILVASQSADLKLIKRNRFDETVQENQAAIYYVSIGPRTKFQLQRMEQAKEKTFNRRMKEMKRAVTVAFKDDDGVCGFIRPGNHVDVIAISASGNISTESDTPGAKATLLKTDKVAKIILQDIEVIAVDQESTSLAGILEDGDRKKSSGTTKKSIQTATQYKEEKASGISQPQNLAGASRMTVIGKITLLLSPENSEKLLVAYNSEQIKFILRNYADKKILKTSGQKLVEAFWGENKVHTIELYRGRDEWGLGFHKDDLDPTAAPERPPFSIEHKSFEDKGL